jgi:hypothetical protein
MAGPPSRAFFDPLHPTSERGKIAKLVFGVALVAKDPLIGCKLGC